MPVGGSNALQRVAKAYLDDMGGDAEPLHVCGHRAAKNHARPTE